MSTLPALPTQKTPGWEFTDLSGLDLDSYSPASNGASAAPEPVLAPAEERVSVTQHDSGAPQVTGDPGQVIVTTIAQAAQGEHAALVSEHLGSLAPADDPFVARNRAAEAGGIFVYVPEGVTASVPLDLRAIQTVAGSAMDWRVLIVVGENAEAEITEQYLSADPGLDALTNSVVEIVCGQSARLRFVSAQDLAERSWVFGTHRAQVGRDAQLDWVALGFGSGRGKVRMDTRLVGRGADARVTGAYVGSGEQHLDFDTTQEHAARNTDSDLAFRGVLGDTSTAVWRGMIRVEPDAQQTDAFQESRNLLLTKTAHADAIPGLEIEADDVRCTHAAAVAQVDAEQVHYLRSHGLGEPTARRIVIEGFMAELVERLPGGRLHDSIADALEARLDEVLKSTSTDDNPNEEER